MSGAKLVTTESNNGVDIEENKHKSVHSYSARVPLAITVIGRKGGHSTSHQDCSTKWPRRSLWQTIHCFVSKGFDFEMQGLSRVQVLP